MPVLSGKRFSELDPAKVGRVGLVLTLLLLVAALNIGSLRSMFATHATADFAQASGLRAGDEVRVSGMAVGSVDSVEIEGTLVRVRFSVADVELGDRTRAAIKTANAAGSRFLSVDPAGDGAVDAIPRARTSVPYSLNAALSDLTRTSGQIDVDQLARSFDAVAGAISGTPEELDQALHGVEALSTAVASRDAALARLLARAESVSGVVAERGRAISSIIKDGDLVFEELAARRREIHELLVHLESLAVQLQGLVEDNRAQLGPALEELDHAIAVLRKNEEAIKFVLSKLGSFTRNLGEAVGGGPYFYGYVPNVTPTNILPVFPELVEGSQALGTLLDTAPQAGGPQ